MKRRDDRDDKDDQPEAAGAAADDPAPGAEEPREDSGLQGVDAAPLAPLTREQVEALRRERDELADQLLRKRAEFDNFRKRVERDRQQAGTEAVAALIKELIPTLDNIDRALESAAQAPSFREGLELIRRGLLNVLEAKGLVAEDPLGQRFDPDRHQALAHEPVAGYPEGTVVEVYGKGYVLRDRLLRPALVKVAKSVVPEPQSQPEPEKVH